MALETLDLRDFTASAWEERLRADRELIAQLLPATLTDIHEVVTARAREANAPALILSGSTARASRTDISDLDYHLIGAKIATRDLSAELDLHVLSAEELRRDILDGDDFIQWSLRFGRIVFDDGTLLLAVRLIAQRGIWPDVARKREHAAKSLALAARVVESGDQDGGQLQVRTALSLAARAYLLSIGEFPMSRAELPSQLAAAAMPAVGHALAICIHEAPALTTLSDAVVEGDLLLRHIGTRPDTEPFPDQR